MSKISKKNLSAGKKKPHARLLSDVSKVNKNLRAAEEDDIFISRPKGEDGETSDEGGDEGDEKAHVRLLNDMSKISKKKNQAAKREVRTTVGTVTEEIKAEDLMNRIGSSLLSQTNKKFKTTQKPLEKHVAQRVKRAAGYEDVAMEVSKWAKVVELRREADTLSFPLKKKNTEFSTVDKVEPPKLKTDLEHEVYSLLEGAKLVKKQETEREKAIKHAMSLEEVKERMRALWREKEMKHRYEEKARRQNQSKSKKHHRILRREKLRKQKTELQELHKKNPDAALEKLQEMELLRIQERMSQRHRSSKWAKFQGLRATRDKEAMAALQENARMHRELKMKINKEEASDSENDSGSEQQKEEAIAAGTYDPMNPWTASLAKKPQAMQDMEEGDTSFTEFKKFWDEVNRRKIEEKKAQAIVEAREQKEREDQREEEAKCEKSEVDKDETDKNSENEEDTDQLKSIDYMFSKAEVSLKKKMKKELKKLGIESTEGKEWTKVKKKKGAKIKNKKAAVVEEFDFSCKSTENKTDERLERVRTLEEVEELGQQEEATDSIEQAFQTLRKGEVSGKTKGVKKSNESSGDKTQETKKKVEVDPTKFIQVNTERLHTAMPDTMTTDNDAVDDSEDDENAEDVIREAFADDYLIDEFKSAKEAAIEESEPKEVSLVLPGWGEWTGPNMKVSARKRKIFRIQAGKKIRKFESVGNVIYNESADVHQNLRKAMVSQLPYQFTSVKDFEASVRAPVGRTFVPEAVHKKLTAPAVTTKKGTIIEPMTENELLALRKEISVKK
ncbi:U3 small nucleolar RNA-associated protein 14 homolog A-like [Penaeus indicus]|uniref:U3 small nucleolar RNA-associated protein 14 homolog A-like n=1 Tax=Penaeus indicus TaxID=29960 RepID=UPI00300D4468